MDLLLDQLGEISKLELVVREHINTHRYQKNLLKDSHTWNQICSSLDVIGDTCLAIESYCHGAFPEDIGLRYVYTYGILQALFIQQDAIRNLTEAFQLTYDAPRALQKIRELRNASIGHPTKQGGIGNRFYNYISRHTLSRAGFELLRSSGNGNYFSEQVRILEITEQQLMEIVFGYQTIAEKLTEFDIMHKEAHRGNPLCDCFHAGIDYQFEKIAQGIFAHSDDDIDFGLTNLRILRDTYIKFRTALDERNELSDHTNFDLNEYFHALDRIESFLTKSTNFIQEADARIYHSYIRSQHDEFVQLAEEIDKQYASAK